MSTILKTKRSLTTGNIPSGLEVGELAVNIPDKKMWIGDASNNSVLLLDYDAMIGGGDTLYSGDGISIDTNDQINLDLGSGSLPTVSALVTNLDKYDKIPYLEYSDGQTKLISASKFLQVGLATALSGAVYDSLDPTTDERTTVAIQDRNPNAFIIQTLQNATGDKATIFKIDTEGEFTSVVDIGGTTVNINPTTSITLGVADLTINSNNISIVNATEMSFNIGEAEISGITQLTAGTGNTIYINGNLVVSGFIETDTGIRGGTDADLEYLGQGMVLDGGEY
jgi:hypothetical protein